MDHIIIGHGQGYFQDAFSQIYEGQFGENHSHPHNEFVYIYSSFGIIGLLLTSYLGYGIISLASILNRSHNINKREFLF